MINYVYKVIEIDTQKEYIGVRTSKELDIGQSYFTSSTDKQFRNNFKNYPQDYICIIEGVYDTREEAIGVEIFLHHFYNISINPLFINKAKQTSTGFDKSGTEGYWKGKKIPDYVKENNR